MTAPTAVRLRGRVLEGPRVRSPFTDVDGLIFGWTFFVNTKATVAGALTSTLEQFMRRDSDDVLNRVPSLDPAGHAVLADQLRIEVGSDIVGIPLDGLAIRFRGGAGEPAPIDRPWPPMLREPEAARHGALYFVEHLLLAGDGVELTATVEPAAQAGAGYRDRGREHVTFMVRPDLEAPVLKEK